MTTITPYITVADATEALKWYQDALDAVITVDPIVMPDGRIGHVEFSVGGARVMMSDPSEEAGVAPPPGDRGNDVTLHVDVDNADRVLAKAGEAGADVVRDAEDTPHGRIGTMIDPYGHRWMINSPLPESSGQ